MYFCWTNFNCEFCAMSFESLLECPSKCRPIPAKGGTSPRKESRGGNLGWNHERRKKTETYPTLEKGMVLVCLRVFYSAHDFFFVGHSSMLLRLITEWGWVDRPTMRTKYGCSVGKNNTTQQNLSTSICRVKPVFFSRYSCLGPRAAFHDLWVYIYIYIYQLSCSTSPFFSDKLFESICCT